MKIASLIVLAYERFDFLQRTMESLINTEMGYPAEIIVHNDGSTDNKILEYLAYLAHERKISILINNCGKNVGIEKSMKRGIACSSGDYIFKLDSDLEFTPNWLKRVVDVLEGDLKIGCVGCIDYRIYDPNDKRFHNVREMDGYLESDNLVSSAYGFRREVYDLHGKAMQHDGWHKYLFKQGYKLAIKDVVENFGFGQSIYVGADGQAVKMENEPLTF